MMKSTKNLSLDALDLSFLSTDEELVIRQVLQRDDSLRRRENRRIRRLRIALPDPKKLKVMTGEWFEELRNRRYGKQSDVTEVVRASMRRKKTAPRVNPHRDFGQTDTKGEQKTPGPQTKTSELHALNPSLDPALCEQEVNLELFKGESTADLDTSVDISERKSPPLHGSGDQTARGRINTNPFLPPQHPEIEYFSTSNPFRPSPRQNALARTNQTDSLNVGEPRSPSSPPGKPVPVPEPQVDIMYMEPGRRLVLPPDIRDAPEHRSPAVVSVNPNTWARSKMADADLSPEKDPKTTNRDPPPVKTPTGMMSRSVDTLSQSGEARFNTERSDSQFVPALSFGTLERSSQTRPRLEQEKVTTGERRAEDTSTLKLSKRVSTKASRDPQPAETQSEAASRSFKYIRENNPFCTTEVVTQQSVQDKLEGMVAKHERPVMDDSLVVDEANPVSGVSSHGHPSSVLPSMGNDIELASEHFTPAKTGGAVARMASQDGDQTHDHPETDRRESTERLEAGRTKQGQIALKTDKAESTESQIEAVDEQPVDGRESEEPEAATEPPQRVQATVQGANQRPGRYSTPTIEIIPPESPEGSEGYQQRATLQVPSFGTPEDSLEDENMDSEDDHSSVSSRDSDTFDLKDFSYTRPHRQRASSFLSVYTDAGDYGNVSVQGSVEFSLRYSQEGEFIICIEQCQDLAFANARKQRTNPYVKTYLYPDKSRHSKRKTSVKKQTVNPSYGGETLKYKISMAELQGRTLNLSVWHNDSRGRNVFLGQVEMELKTWDWDYEASACYDLQPKFPEAQEAEYYGMLTVALKYTPPGSSGDTRPDSGEIHVWLKEAKELRKIKTQGADSFIKCYMLPDTSRKSRQKTRVVKSSLDPVFNHAMVYDGFGEGEVREACCELTVWDHNALFNQFLGGVRLSLGSGKSYGKNVDWMDSVGQEIELWERMLGRPDVWVEGEIPLRSSMTPKK